MALVLGNLRLYQGNRKLQLSAMMSDSLNPNSSSEPEAWVKARQLLAQQNLGSQKAPLSNSFYPYWNGSYGYVICNVFIIQ